MFLLVMPDGARYWRCTYRHGGVRKQLSLGVYPDVSLEEARTRRTELRAMVAEGIDPSKQRKAEQSARLAEAARAFIVPRFALDSDGGLCFRFGGRSLLLTPIETAELRAFLDATRAVTPKVTPCP